MLVKYPVGQPRVDGFCRLRIKFSVYASNRVIIGRILTRALGYVQLDFGSKSSRFPSYPRIQTRPFLESPALIPIFSSPRIIPLSTGRGSKLSFDSQCSNMEPQLLIGRECRFMKSHPITGGLVSSELWLGSRTEQFSELSTPGVVSGDRLSFTFSGPNQGGEIRIMETCTHKVILRRTVERVTNFQDLDLPEPVIEIDTSENQC